MAARIKNSGSTEVASALKLAFNEDFYSESCPESIRYPSGILQHYLDIGWKNGFDPTPGFSGNSYLKANPDVARSGSNPFVHYLQYGIAEGRGGHSRSRVDELSFDFKNSGELGRSIQALTAEDFKRLASSASAFYDILKKIQY